MKISRPTEEEFNSQWLTPSEAMETVCDSHWEDYQKQKWILNRLVSGLILAVARHGPDYHGDLEEFVLVPKRNFSSLNDDELFWETGDGSFSWVENSRGSSGRATYFDIRFAPQSFSGNIIKMESTGAPSAPVEAVEHVEHVEHATPKTPILQGDIEKVAKLIAELWGTDINELDALAMARACFPKRSVAHQRFLSLYRSYRPAKNRGPQPKNSI